MISNDLNKLAGAEQTTVMNTRVSSENIQLTPEWVGQLSRCHILQNYDVT